MLGNVAAVEGSAQRALQGAALPRGWELREALAVLDPDLYANGPGPDRPFLDLPGLASPCWRHGDEGSADDDAGNRSGVRCLPAAMILGGFQCGSQSLWAAVYKHPLIVKTDVSRYHFWAEHDKKSAGLFSGLKAGADKIMDWQRLAPGAATGGSGGGGGSGEGAGSREGEAAGEEEAAEPVDEAWIRRQPKMMIDGSASTFAFYYAPGVRTHRTFLATMQPCWKGCHDDHKEGAERDVCLDKCFTTSQQADRQVAKKIGIPYNDMSLPLVLSAVYGKRPPRMIIMLRNPIERLYSSFWRYSHYNTKYGNTVQGFEAFVDEQLSALQRCQARAAPPDAPEVDPATSCLLHFETWGLQEERVFFHADQILRGVYSVYLDSWFKYFDRRQFLVIKSEDYFADPLATYRRALSFLGLDPRAISVRADVERLSKLAASGDDAALAAPAAAHKKKKGGTADGDNKLWADIKHDLLNDPEQRFPTNRAAALAARRDSSGGGGGGSGGAVSDARAEAAVAATAGGGGGGQARPPMPAAVRKRLLDFYEPYNRRLAELLGDPDFISGWQ
ncbi:hypothetical protein CHLRE_09g393321v5 [Chlamydomonas reinhardtii]|uniref:Sulfotransferase n=1 Tax=Chlamydomonas reinhardtii TaxID=3055 RepID=A0A2K3DEC7_CHLRE|nr:uncharacterized protein CHLRE_09g393321v5 [Chlamydomonas reinhardtii]PNW78886.1 hypothetical protein CHLRE_09g393321v5 [Chlamydomonas reinhardtii]